MIFLLVLHHIADVAFQPSWLIKSKHEHWFSVYEHCFIWAGMISAGLYVLGEYSLAKFSFLFIGHFIIDMLKYRYTTDYRWVYLDQFLHYLQILIVLYAV